MSRTLQTEKKSNQSNIDCGYMCCFKRNKIDCHVNWKDIPNNMMREERGYLYHLCGPFINDDGKGYYVLVILLEKNHH